MQIPIAFVAMVIASEAEDVEQKKRGAGKPTSLNAIPSGAQKPDYTYSIYTQNPNLANNSPSPSYQSAPYQSQIQNSFYPTQPGASQYYQSSNIGLESQGGAYLPHPQLNLIPPPSNSQFVPLNFIPTPGYQSKYQIIPSKSPTGNIQLAIISPSSLLQSSPYGYQNPIFAGHQKLGPQQSYVSALPQGQYTPNYQQVPAGQHYAGQQSTMLLVAQPNPSLYPNLQNVLYPNSVPNLYNYYQQPQQQVKYNYVYGPSPSQQVQQHPGSEYDKGTSLKEENEISVQANDYLSPAESNNNYKNTYATSRPYKIWTAWLL